MPTGKMKQLEKRKFVYCQQPQIYEVGPCLKCGGYNITWSEFVKHLWCYDCEIDFIPQHWGIFDGPIPLYAAQVMGISFDRIEIATKNIIKFGTPEWDKAQP